jgi:hydrophobic/amphiphilic exporter-1 (mainly G- bacteria), HAE1 family
MNLPELCIRRPVMATLLTAAIVLFGIIGYRSLPVSALPQVDFPTIQVSANLPGASPETMAATVATPLERQFSTIPGITSITSTSTIGVSQVTLQFELARNIDAAALDVQSALSVAAKKLPPEMTTPPSFLKVNPADAPILFIALTSSTLPLSKVDEYAETLISDRISIISGVGQVDVLGSQKYAVRVQINPSQLASRGIGIDEIQKALAAASSNSPVGVLSGSAQQLTLQVSGQRLDAAAFRPLIVAHREGAAVRLSDVALVTDSVQNDHLASWINGQRGIVLAVVRQPGANTIELATAIRKLLPVLREQIPASINVDLIIDRSISIQESVEDVKFTLVLTGVLVVLVIFLFLRRLSATLIPAVALPVSIIGTFAGMSMMGFSLNNISLLGLTLAVGFVVDDAIVMLENIVRYIEKGATPMEAALRGSREIAFTILSMTLSLVAVFIPLLFMGGLVGRLFHEFAVTVSLAILISGFVSLTLTPMMGSRLLRAEQGPENRAGRALEGAFQALLRGYGRSLTVVLRHRFITLLVTVATFGATVYVFDIAKKGFFPTEDTGVIQGSTEAAQDVSFDAMVAQQQRVAEILSADPAVQFVSSSVGVGGAAPLNSGRLYLSLKPRAERPPVTQVIQRLRGPLAQVPGINTYLQPVQNLTVGGRQSKSQYQYTLQASDLQLLYQWGPRLETELKNLPLLQDVTTDLQTSSPQLVVNVDQGRAALLGISDDQIRNALYNAFGARQVATIYTAANDYGVILETTQNFQNSPGNVGRLHVRATDGTLVALDSIATLQQGVGPLTINHQGQLPSVTLSFNLAPGAALSEAIDAVRTAELRAGLPATVFTSFGGTAQVFEESLAGQGLLLLAALVTIYIILGILYESFIHPLTILSGLPSAGLGAVLTLMAFDIDLSLIAMIGVIMLIGIVKKNAIMMVDFAVEREREGHADPEKAIYDAAILRFRPIMMTTLAAIMGILPIAIGIGAGSELRQPLGIAVAGGLVVSQILTLYITPVVFLYLDRLRRRPAPAATAAD